MRSEGYSTSSVCACLLLNISLFTWLFVPQTILTFLAADEGQNFKRFSLKMLRCEARAFLLVRLYDKSASRKTRMRMNLDHVASGHFVLGSSLRVRSRGPPRKKSCTLSAEIQSEIQKSNEIQKSTLNSTEIQKSTLKSTLKSRNPL